MYWYIILIGEYTIIYAHGNVFDVVEDTHIKSN